MLKQHFASRWLVGLAVSSGLVMAQPLQAQTSASATAADKSITVVGTPNRPADAKAIPRKNNFVRRLGNAHDRCGSPNPEEDAAESYLDSYDESFYGNDGPPDNVGRINDLAPYGDASLSSEEMPRGYAGTALENGDFQDNSGCGPSDRNFAAGRNYIARNDTKLKEGFAAFDAKDYTKARVLFKQAYDKIGYAQAAFMMGKLYLYGLGGSQDTGAAIVWFKKIVEERYTPPRVPPRFDPAKPEYKTVRQDAAMTLATIYLGGMDVPADAREARKWYAKADYFQYVPAANIMGLIYQSGFGGDKNDKKAFERFLEAASVGYAPAQYNVGLIYYSGTEATPKDMQRAVAWFYEAAKRGHPNALYTMARLYDLGEGVAADPQKAIVYYKEASLKGQANAQNALGTYFYEGQIVPQDLIIARKWFEQAAKQGQVDAMFNLAVMYYRGEGGDKDLAMAYIWFTLAKASGHAQADAALKIIEPQLTPEQRAKVDSILKPAPKP